MILLKSEILFFVTVLYVCGGTCDSSCFLSVLLHFTLSGLFFGVGWLWGGEWMVLVWFGGGFDSS